jgi:acetoin utilization protein AcuB
LLVKDLMHAAVLTIAPDAGLDRALVIMNTKRIRHLPVVENGKMIGLVSNRDLHLSMVEESGPQKAPKGMYLPALTKIRAVMKKDVLTVKPDDTLFDAARVMCEKKIGCLPVLNADGSLAGILTETDLLQLLVKLLQEKEA